jgi:transposase
MGSVRRPEDHVAMPRNFIECDGDQPSLMPPSLREWLPEDDLAWCVIDAEKEMDVSAFYAAYREDGRGRPAYEPSMMVALVLFAFATKQRSSRGIERHCRRDIAYRVITSNEVPDHATIDVATRRVADQRRPADTGVSVFDVAIHQIRAADADADAARTRAPSTALPPALDVDDLTILTGWAEAVAETLAYATHQTLPLLREAGAEASWRGSLGLLEAPAPVADAIEALGRVVQSSIQGERTPSFDAVLAATQTPQPEEQALDGLARRVLRSTLDQLHSRRGRTVR